MAARKNSPQRRRIVVQLSYTLLHTPGSTKYVYNPLRWWCQGCLGQNIRVLRPSLSSTLFVSFPNIMQSMDDQCPVCKSDRYLNPKLRLLVSSCYHKMFVLSCKAHSCLIINYSVGASHALIVYLRLDLRLVRFAIKFSVSWHSRHRHSKIWGSKRKSPSEDELQKSSLLICYCHLPLQLASRFNKRREDFPDLRSYNDYLEEVEDISKLLGIASRSRVAH
jgi:hypothetical protein